MSDPQAAIRRWFHDLTEPHGNGARLSAFTGYSSTKISRMRNISTDDPKKRQKIPDDMIRMAAGFFNSLPPGYEQMTSWLKADPSEGARVPNQVVVSDEAQTVPVRGVAAGSHERGSFQFTGSEIDYVPRPPALAGVRDLFAIYVEGDSMEPQHAHGDLRFIDPHRPVRPGDTVVIEARDDPDEEEWAMIGKLISRGDDFRIQKLNPPREIRVPKLYVKSVHRVLNVNELFGR